MCDTDVLIGGFGLFGGRGEYMGKIKVRFMPIKQITLEKSVYLSSDMFRKKLHKKLRKYSKKYVLHFLVCVTVI